MFIVYTHLVPEMISFGFGKCLLMNFFKNVCVMIILLPGESKITRLIIGLLGG